MVDETPGRVLRRLLDDKRFTATGIWWEDDDEMDVLAAAFLDQVDERILRDLVDRRFDCVWVRWGEIPL